MTQILPTLCYFPETVKHSCITYDRVRWFFSCQICAGQIHNNSYDLYTIPAIQPFTSNSPNANKTNSLLCWLRVINEKSLVWFVLHITYSMCPLPLGWACSKYVNVVSKKYQMPITYYVMGIWYYLCSMDMPASISILHCVANPVPPS